MRSLRRRCAPADIAGTSTPLARFARRAVVLLALAGLLVAQPPRADAVLPFRLPLLQPKPAPTPVIPPVAEPIAADPAGAARRRRANTHVTRGPSR